jgi:lysozyme
LWIANYSKAPAGYPNSISWQYSQYGQVSGIIGNADMDYFIENIYLNNKPVPDLVKPQTFYSSAVATAQYQLNRAMNSKLTVNGILDQKTIDALANFQNLMGITARGNVTADTQCALNNILAFPNCHIGGGNKYAVKYLQYRFAIPVDGVFGQQTRNLVSNFQIGHKLQATGVADKATWLQLFK